MPSVNITTYDPLLMASSTITRSEKRLTGSVSLPASKSISNRLLIIQSLCDTDLRIGNLSKADDTRLLQDLLVGIKADQTTDVNHKTPSVSLNCLNAGTVMRFITAYLATTPGTWNLFGSDRMHERPIGILVEALRALGASIEYTGKTGYPPLRITGKPLKGGEVEMDVSVSSQFVSAMLLIAPCLPEGLTIHLIGKQVSSSYVEMTMGVMHEFGIPVERRGASMIIKPGGYSPETSTTNGFTVEADWSSAAFWYEAAALADSAEIRLPGLHQDSLQGDAILADLFRPLGVETSFDNGGVVLKKAQGAVGSWQLAVGNLQSSVHSVRGWGDGGMKGWKNKSDKSDEGDGGDGSDEGNGNNEFVTRNSNHSEFTSSLVPRSLSLDLSAFPDLAPPLIVTCAALGIPASFTGLHHLRNKESDRLQAIRQELNRIGISIRHHAIPGRDLHFTTPSGIIETLKAKQIEPDTADYSHLLVQTYGDHRIAMAFAMLALRTGVISIDNPSVVSKSYPGFWEELKRLGFEVWET